MEGRVIITKIDVILSNFGDGCDFRTFYHCPLKINVTDFIQITMNTSVAEKQVKALS